MTMLKKFKFVILFWRSFFRLLLPKVCSGSATGMRWSWDIHELRNFQFSQQWICVSHFPAYKCEICNTPTKSHDPRMKPIWILKLWTHQKL